MRRFYGIIVFFIVIAATMGCDAKVAGLSLHPDSHDFGTVNLGDKKLMHFRVKNLSNDTFTITKIQLMGVSTNNFRITAGYATPKYLQSQGFVIISVEYEPKNAGLHVAFIQITHNGPKQSERIDLLGTGFPVPRMNISTVNIDFGVVYVTRSGVEEIVLENVGTDRLIVSSLNFDNPTITEFTIKSGGTIPIMINPGETHTIEVEMTPPNDGNYSNILLISHNAINKISPVRVILQGEGVTYAPEMDLNQTSPWDFGSVAKTMPGIFMLEIESVGNDDLTLTSFSLQKGTEFTYEGLEDSNGNDLNLPQVILIGDTVFAKIGFSPSANTTYNDTLSIIHDAINHNIPLEIELTGEGRGELTRTFDTVTKTKENWTVPVGVSFIRIEAWGAGGGGQNYGSPGKGARMRGDFNVRPGDVLKIAVGEVGQTGGQGGGGGGGTFVVNNTQPLVIAGAGGGSHYNNGNLLGKDAVITQTCTPHNSTGVGYTGGSGGGWSTDGANGDYGTLGGKGWANGLTGGIKHTGGGNHWSNGDGGYGGGGGGCWAPGSAGGYNGGVSATSYGNQTPGGTGGGSINNGTNQSNTAGVQVGNGKVIITY